MQLANTTQPGTHRVQASPKVSGDELFVPASHLLVIDRQVSHPAFRLWCVLHRLWFLHEPPTMDLLQKLMGTSVSDKATPHDTWQPATRRSIERWLTELEQAGWLIWVRREETTRRYHLRTSARSASDTAVLTELRSLLNSGKTTLAEVQALLTALGSRDDAPAGSHESIPGSHQDAVNGTTIHNDATIGSLEAIGDTIIGSRDPIVGSHLATVESHGPASLNHRTTVESHNLIVGSHQATAESQHTIVSSQRTTVVTHDATLPSHERAANGVLVRQSDVPYNETPENQIHEDSTPPPAAASTRDGDGGGPTETERYLLRQGFSTRAAHEFRDLNLSAVQTDLERRRGFGQGIGAIVITWRVEPPQPALTKPNALSEIACLAANAKAQALVIAPPDASPFEIQYLALDLEDGCTAEKALANLLARRAEELVTSIG